jgi:hypothetical protein
MGSTNCLYFSLLLKESKSPSHTRADLFLDRLPSRLLISSTEGSPKETIMKKGARTRRRVTLYLRSIGLGPTAAGALTQYAELELEQRKLARRSGRQFIREAGSIKNAVAALNSPVVQETKVSSTAPIVAQSRSRSKEKVFDQIHRRWSPLTPPCPSCRMRNGFPKRSWSTREWADEVWAKQHDRDLLRVYQCPAQPGFWHLGHISRSFASVVPVVVSISPPTVAFETGGRA